MMIEGNKKVKRWVLVVICLSCRGIHLESLERYNTVSLLAGFERFFARRGRPRIIWVDAGTNLGGGQQRT